MVSLLSKELTLDFSDKKALQLFKMQKMLNWSAMSRVNKYLNLQWVLSGTGALFILVQVSLKAVCPLVVTNLGINHLSSSQYDCCVTYYFGLTM